MQANQAGQRFTSSVVAAGVTGLVLVVAAVAAVSGAPLWPVLIIAVVPWVPVLRARLGGAIALAGVFIGTLWMLLVLLLILAPVHAPLLPSTVVVVTLCGVAGCVVWARSASWAGLPSRALLAVAPVGVGSVAWLAASIGNAIARPASGLSWAMHGDAASYLLFSRAILADNGIVPGAGGNPVPLPSALFALFAAPGRASVSPANLLAHDLAAYEALQILTIAASCLFAGVLALTIAQRIGAGRLVAGAAGLAGSVLPLSWMLTTNTLIYGYYDAQLALPVVFALIMVALRARDHPVAIILVLAVGGTVTLAVWSPLAIVPCALLVQTVVAYRRTLWGARGVVRIALALAALQLLAWILAVSLPSLLAQGRLLSSFGSIYTFTHSLFPSLGVIVVLLALFALRVTRWRDALTGLVLPVALAIGLGALLFANRNSPGLWTYFPIKFEWLSVDILLVLLVGLLPAVLLPWLSGRRARLIAVISVLSMAAVVALEAPDEGTGTDPVTPLSWIGQSARTADGGAPVSALILRDSDPSHPVLYWRSAVSNERYINYWLIELAARTMQNNALRKYAFTYHESGTADLCTILRLTPGTVTVRTRDASLAGKVTAACGDLGARVVSLG